MIRGQSRAFCDQSQDREVIKSAIEAKASQLAFRLAVAFSIA